MLNDSAYTITLSGTGYANIFTTTNSDFNLTGTLNLNSALELGNSNVFTIKGGRLVFQQDGIFTGGHLTFSNANNMGLLGAAQNQTLTLASGTFINGTNGTIGSSSIGSNYYGGNLVNNGTISADVNGGFLQVQPGFGNGSGNNQYGTFTNTGTLQALNGGGLYVNSGSMGTSTGTIRVDAGSNIFANNLTQTAGNTVVNGTLTANIFTVQGGALVGNGTVSGSVQNQGGTVSAGSAPATAGTLTVANNYSQDASSVFQVDIGGATQGVDYDLLKVNGTATLGGQVQVQLLNNFTPYVGETFDVLNYKNRTGAFSSIFASGGAIYSLNYNDTSGVATLQLDVAAVPETGTLVSLGLLAAGGVFSVRRKARQSKKTPVSPPSVD